MTELNDQNLVATARNIRLVIFDIDGVLTDGTLFYGEHGEIMKPFNAKDGVGFRILQDNGIAVAVITAKRSAPLERRMNDLKVKHFYPGCHNKAGAFAELKHILCIDNHEAAYVGDDVLDLPVMEKVGLAISPADGYRMVQEVAHIITEADGGKGVVREVADLLVGSRTDLKQVYRQLVTPKTEITQ